METPATGDGLIRVFISSPSDVRSERLIAERLIQRLHVEFSYHFRVEPVLWEREPLVATEHFQASLVPPSETDIVVVILWSRLGVSLPIDTFPGRVTGRVVTGTEWEFEDALSAYRRRGLPHLLFYRKTAPVMASLDDPDAVRQQLHQKQLVQDFVKRWFVDSDAKTLTAAFREFTTASEFEDMLGTHLRELLQRRLENAESVEPRGGIRWHQGSPYRGLEVFELSHAQIFFGRARERTEIRELLVRRIEAKNAFLLIFGASGSGKSSIVRAGLLADLTLPGMIGDVALCRYALFRPSDAPDDLLMGLAAALMAPAALPELGELRHDVSRLATLLCDAPQHLATPIEAALARAAAHAHLTERGEARIVLVIDQLEEIFTIDRIDANDRAAFVTAIDALARSGLIWVVATMRSDFFQRLPELPLLSTMSSGEGRYLLGPPDAVALRQIIRQPAIEAGLRFQRDRVRELDLADQVERDARESRDALPLLEFALDQLWQRRSDRGEMTFAAYEALGSLEGAIGHRAEQEFLQHPPRSRRRSRWSCERSRHRGLTRPSPHGQ
jgi:Novel STAND NTPase 1